MHVLLEKEEEKAVVDQVTYKFPVHNEAKQDLSGQIWVFGSVCSCPVRKLICPVRSSPRPNPLWNLTKSFIHLVWLDNYLIINVLRTVWIKIMWWLFKRNKYTFIYILEIVNIYIYLLYSICNVWPHCALSTAPPTTSFWPRFHLESDRSLVPTLLSMFSLPNPLSGVCIKVG